MSDINKNIIIIFDESGSMEFMGKEPVQSLNAFIDEQKKGDNNCIYTLVTFSDNHKTVFDHVNIKEIEEMKYEDYKPNGCTALNDAIYETISRELEKNNKNGICLIITDGEENASKKYRSKDVRKIVNLAKNTYNWDIRFIGANIDSIKEGTNIGLQSNSCYQFNQRQYGNLTNLTRSISADINNYTNLNMSKIDNLKIEVPNKTQSIQKDLPPPLSPIKNRQYACDRSNFTPIKFNLSPITPPIKSC
jgi:hypothetical protein